MQWVLICGDSVLWRVFTVQFFTVEGPTLESSRRRLLIALQIQPTFQPHAQLSYLIRHTYSSAPKPAIFLIFSVYPSICTFSMLFLQPACLLYHVSQWHPLQVKSHILYEDCTDLLHTLTHSQSKSITISSKCPHYGSLHYYNLLFLLPSLSHWLHQPILK